DLDRCDRARAIPVREDLHAVDLAQAFHEVLGEIAGAVLDRLSPDRRLEPERFGERHDGGLIALPVALDHFRDADRAAAGADGAGPQLGRHALAHEEDTDLFRPARPFVAAPAVEVRLDVAQIDVEQPERLRAVQVAQHAVLAGDAADLL